MPACSQAPAVAASLKSAASVAAAGIVNTPEGASATGPILGGSRYEFTLTASPGARLTLAMMFGQSNDIFYAADAIDLFKGGRTLQRDVTSAVSLWDAGTEINQEPGTGADQAPLATLHRSPGTPSVPGACLLSAVRGPIRDPGG